MNNNNSLQNGVFEDLRYLRVKFSIIHLIKKFTKVQAEKEELSALLRQEKAQLNQLVKKYKLS